MSTSGDLTTFKRITRYCNNVPSRTAGAATLKKQVDYIRTTKAVDAYGNIILPSYFGVSIPLADDSTCMTRTAIKSKFDNEAYIPTLPLIYPVSPFISTPEDPKSVKFKFSGRSRVSQTFMFTNPVL